MKVLEVNKNSFEEEVINSKVKVLVDFNADWCGPCIMLRPIIDEVASEVDTKIVSVNIDNEEELAEEYNVSSIPCLVVFESGKEVNRSVGLISKEDVINLLGGK